MRDEVRAHRPLLYQVNTRVLLGERGRALGRPATLDDFPEAMLDDLAARAFRWVWFLGVWTTGPAARAVSRSRKDWRAGFVGDLPDLRDDRLLRVLGREEVHTGRWQLCECRAAWSGNPTWDRFVVMAWDGGSPSRLFVAVNYGATRAQCWAQVPFSGLAGRIAFRNLLGEERHERDGPELASKGLYLDLPPWGVNVFAVEPDSKG